VKRRKLRKFPTLLDVSAKPKKSSKAAFEKKLKLVKEDARRERESGVFERAPVPGWKDEDWYED